MLNVHVTPGKPTGILFKRLRDSTLGDKPRNTSTLTECTRVGDTQIRIHDVSVKFKRGLAKLSGKTYTILDASIANNVQTLTLDPPLETECDTSSSVGVYTTQNAAIVYDEAVDVFRFVRAPALEADMEYLQEPAVIYGRNIMLENESFASYMDVEVSIAVSSSTPVAIPKTKTRGSYQVLVHGEPDDTPAACFFISKASSSSSDFSVFRVTSSPSSRGENIGLTWPAGGVLHAHHTDVRVSGDTSEVVTYAIKIICNK